MHDRRKLGLIFGCVLALGPTSAATSEPTREQAIFAASNLQQEVIECVVFQDISEAAFSKPPRYPGWEQAVEKSRQHRQALVQIASMLSGIMGQKPEAVQERLRFANEKLDNEFGRNFSNYSILLAKYAAPCSDLVQGTSSRMDYWLSQAEVSR